MLLARVRPPYHQIMIFDPTAEIAIPLWPRKLPPFVATETVTLFEQSVPAGSKNSWLHLHRDGDEVAWVLEGEFTFRIGDETVTGGPGTCAFMPRNVPHAWKNSGTVPCRAGPCRVVFLYTPARAGQFVEEMIERPGEGELKKRLEDSGWEVLGPSPL